jgi:putative PEP-CTERM system histidine kinase
VTPFTIAYVHAILAGLAMLSFGGATIWLMTRPRKRMAALMPTHRWLVLAVGGMACWCASLYIFGPEGSNVLLGVALRNFAMLAWIAHTFWRAEPPPRMLRLIFRLLMTICLVALLFGILAMLVVQGSSVTLEQDWMYPGLALVAMLTASGGLLLIDNGIRHHSSEMRMPVLAVAGGFAMLWAYELNVQFIKALTGQPAQILVLLLPLVALLTLPTFLLAAMDVGREKLRLSRSVAMRTIILLVMAAYLVLIGLTGAVARFLGGNYGQLAQGVFLIVALGVGGVLFASFKARAWLAVMIAKHFFEHRYDYRAEWMRFTATLGQDDGSERDIYLRVGKALAELTNSPGALVMLPNTQGDFSITDRWQWPSDGDGDTVLPLRSGFMLQQTEYIVDLDRERSGDAPSHENLALPVWLMADLRAWVVVPVLHFGRMLAVVILHRPAISRRLDWEDLDVLRIAGKQAASYLAESQSQQALSEAKRFDEFNRRFAFIMHDIKNLASQLGLLAVNAERHADNAEFRADMTETLRLSVGRLNELLARLSSRQQSYSGVAEEVRIEPLLRKIAKAARQRHPLFLESNIGLSLWGNADAIHQIVDHLVTNAIDASNKNAPVQIIAEREGERVRIDVLDQGEGMSAEFIRSQLFKPFVSTKDGGFGLGAFEALQLAQAMGGTIEVASTPGEGSCFTLWLPADQPVVASDDFEFLAKAIAS